MLKPLNPEMIILAREYRALTQKELADASSLKQPQIAMIEGGIENSASIDTIKAISEALNFPIEFFYMPENRLGFGSSSVYYRKSSSITASDRRYISSITNLIRIGIRKFMDFVEIESDFSLPYIDLEQVDGSPSKAASIMRATWGLPDGPIQNLTNFVERTGVIVVEVDFGLRGISGTSIRITDTPPIIFISSALTPDRYRFTLAHELAHLVIHDVPRETMEDEADEFASELLMQKHEFKISASQFGKQPTLRNLIALKPYWKVAVSAMIMRLHQLNMISENTKRSLFIQMSNLKMRLNEPQPFQKEKPILFSKLVRSAIGDLTNETDVSKNIMKLPQDVFKFLYASSLHEEAKRESFAHLRLV
ncbi:ImmA/IrrE family metallo-endopeptidase [Nitrosomonas sp. Nm33]|uniref:helix-turn-helix domain-containing protein n=1 Tax=Nitrosomonas sp. Nm33 TaxID=133724 RepID=UPI00089CFA42|nr:XRE family transcriptional regulator [Nitrosomonas sp. Nm33]SDY40132.1 Zn-dependent peptidase ImmA, M78 family [Nitrosomonas sp. Nm33]